MSLALQGVAHGFSGNRTAMDISTEQARATGSDSGTVNMITLGNGLALYHLGEGQVREALDALDRAMEVLRAAGSEAHPFPGRWAVSYTHLDVYKRQAPKGHSGGVGRATRSARERRCATLDQCPGPRGSHGFQCVEQSVERHGGDTDGGVADAIGNDQGAGMEEGAA